MQCHVVLFGFCKVNVLLLHQIDQAANHLVILKSFTAGMLGVTLGFKLMHEVSVKWPLSSERIILQFRWAHLNYNPPFPQLFSGNRESSTDRRPCTFEASKPALQTMRNNRLASFGKFASKELIGASEIMSFCENQKEWDPLSNLELKIQSFQLLPLKTCNRR